MMIPGSNERMATWVLPKGIGESLPYSVTGPSENTKENRLIKILEEEQDDADRFLILDHATE